MDVNDTKFHLLLGFDDWASCTSDGLNLLRDGQKSSTAPTFRSDTNLGWDDERCELRLRRVPYKFERQKRDRTLSLNARRGAAGDRFGNLFWIGESRKAIFVTSTALKETKQFWSVNDGWRVERGGARFGQSHFDLSGFDGGFELKAADDKLSKVQLSGLAVTADNYLVVGTLRPAGLMIFDLWVGGAPKRFLLWPEALEFTPIDLAARAEGGVCVLDRSSRHKRCWVLDRSFNLVVPPGSDDSSAATGDFHPANHEAASEWTSSRNIEGPIEKAFIPIDFLHPIAIEVLPDDTMAVLSNTSAADDPFRGQAVLHTYQQGGGWQRLDLPGVLNSAGYDFAFLPDDSISGALGRIFIAAIDGFQCYAFRVSRREDQAPRLEFLVEYLPMRLFGGKGLAHAARAIYYDFGQTWIPLVRQDRARYLAEATFYTPYAVTGDDSESGAGGFDQPFDGREPGCVWHRLMLDADIPTETEVEVWSRAADTLEGVRDQVWKREPDFYLRGEGSELPFLARHPSNGSGTWELLFQHARGRYLQLKFTVRGNERSTPRLFALRAYFPRFSYLQHYLPPVYSENAHSASFVERFLANFEGFYTALEDKIASVQMLFDPRSAPAEASDWLAGWIGLVLDPAWDERRRRLLIQHAAEFFRRRGTSEGLLIALHLALDEQADESIFDPRQRNDPQQRGIRIVESYRVRRPLPGRNARQAASTHVGDLTQKPWTPEQGGKMLHQRYRRYCRIPQIKLYSIKRPDGEQSKRWIEFSRAVLGFVPRASARHLQTWREFLAHRYRHIAVLNEAYEHSSRNRYRSFNAIELPERLPRDGAPLKDWYEFEGAVLPAYDTAHRFGVLLPTPAQRHLEPEEFEQRLNLAKKIIELEKPAHTAFSLEFYWSLFRLGEARLGQETLLDTSSRTPACLNPTVLGHDFLGESYLSPLRRH